MPALVLPLRPRGRGLLRGVSGSTSGTSAQKRVCQEEVRVTGGTRTLVVPIPDVYEVPPPSKDRLILSAARVMDPNFQVQDVSDTQVEVMLDLPPGSSLVFQALYESFFNKHWVATTRSFLVDRQCKQIYFQIHGLVIAVLNLIDLVKVEERGNEMDRIEASLTSLIDAEKSKCSTPTEEKDVAMEKLASLQEELDG